MRLTITDVADISERLRYALEERGFFKAAAVAPDVTVVSRSPSEEVIDVACHVNLGQQYRLKEIAFSNVNPSRALAFPITTLRQSFLIKDGDIFGVERIRIGLENLRKLYANSGYINFTPVPNTESDDQLGTISLRVDLDEGLVFHLGTLVLEGAEPVAGAGAKLMQSWKQYQGRVFSGQLLDNFMRENAAYLPQHAMDWQLFQMETDPVSRVVSVRLELDEPPPIN